MNGTLRVIHGTLATASADNLASHSLGGFKESCSAYRCCRQCLATKETAKTKVSYVVLFKLEFDDHVLSTSYQFLENQFTLRDKTSHQYHCTLLEGDSGCKFSKLYGINRDSVLNELSYFNVCEGGLLPDIMHDILEGALQYEMKLMLKVFIRDEKYFSLSELNTRIESIDLGYMESKDRPSPNADSTLRCGGSSKNSLKQAGQLCVTLHV